ncbi:MAG: UDP-N-acetylmuramate--L-alanine ligase [Candidatus Subteraquimicrobiales bacterium]|nr:UDP-N-acetylmuramate--L-alanine ligase [Candidatus Subteraquimicrobiales bacterium]
MVVYSSAILKNNCEILSTKDKNLPVIPRAKILAWLFNGRRGIAVAGTHGKTTTTSMVSLVLERLNLSPTFLIGGELNDIGSNAKFGKGNYLVAEADESDGSFLFLNPEIIIVTNIEADHLEYYGSMNRIKDAFFKFIDKLPSEGCVIVCKDHLNVKELIKKSKRNNFITYGMSEDCDFFACDIVFKETGSKFKVFRNKEKLGEATLKVPGMHNVYNAVAAFSLADLIGLDFNSVAGVLGEFLGVKRRFEIMGTFGGVTVVDDYAHHPTEVSETLKAARHGDWRRIISVFQPHRYTRTQFLFKEFATSFEFADIVVITDVYSAGEEPIPGVSGKLIFDEVQKNTLSGKAVYIPQKSKVEKFLLGNVEAGDLVLIMGAGDIWTVGENVLEKVREQSIIQGR